VMGVTGTVLSSQLSGGPVFVAPASCRQSRGRPALACGLTPASLLCRPYGACDRSCCLPTTYVVGFPMSPFRGSCGAVRNLRLDAIARRAGTPAGLPARRRRYGCGLRLSVEELQSQLQFLLGSRHPASVGPHLHMQRPNYCRRMPPIVGSL
jgi:hypothetical protein